MIACDDEREHRRRAQRVEPVGPLRDLAVEHPREEARRAGALVDPPDEVGAALLEACRPRASRRCRCRWACRSRRASPASSLGSGSFGMGYGARRRGRARRVEDVPDPARVLARVAGADRLELGGDAVARADLDLAAAHARLEAVERANRRAADHLALEVVDAAVAGADEVAGRLDEAHRAAEVGAAGRDRDERALGLVERGRRVGRANVRRGLPASPTPVDDVKTTGR